MVLTMTDLWMTALAHLFDVTVTVDVAAPIGANQTFTVCHRADWNFDVSSYISNFIDGQHVWTIAYANNTFVTNEYLGVISFGDQIIAATGVLNNSTLTRTLVYTVTPQTLGGAGTWYTIYSDYPCIATGHRRSSSPMET